MRTAGPARVHDREQAGDGETGDEIDEEEMRHDPCRALPDRAEDEDPGRSHRYGNQRSAQPLCAVTAADLHMATDYTPYEGRALTGWAHIVISNGRVVLDGQGFHDPGPVGRLLRSRALLDGHHHVLAAQPHR